MELDYALLADSARISEGKTFILGGGLSILWRMEYPAPLGVSLRRRISRSHPRTQVRAVALLPAR
jgi:hypothetical protein